VAQQTIRKVNIEHKLAGLFQIELYNWDQIKDLLNQYQQVATEIYNLGKNEQLTAIQQGVSSVRAVLEVIRDEKGSEGFHAEIDSAKQHIEQHDYQMARLILHQLRSRHWDKLDNGQRFRLLANLGGAYLGEGELQKAAQFFWEAKPYQPDDEKACANEALGFQITGNPEKAFELTDKYRIQFPTSARILGIWVRNSPATKRLEDLAKYVPDTCMADAELCASLAVKAASENQFDKAETLARKAISLSSDWSFPRVLLAKMIMCSHMDKALEHDGQGISFAERVREAEQLCSEAISLAQEEKATHTEAEAYSARALIREQAGRKKEAKADVLRAYQLDPSDPAIVREYALILQEQGENDGAVELVRKLVQGEHVDPMSWYVLGLTLRNRKGPGDAEEAARIFADLANRSGAFPAGFREHMAEGAVAHYCALQRWEDAQSAVEGIPSDLISPLVRATLMAVVKWRKKDQEEAFKWADSALVALTPETPRMERRLLAKLLSECGRHADALGLWKGLTEFTQLDDDTRSFLDCARRLGRADLVVHGCQKLRAVGVDSEDVVNLELSFLERFDVEQAIRLLQAYLETHPDAKFMRLRLSLIGLRLNRTDLVSAGPALLPSLEEVDPEIGRAVVQVLKMGGRPLEATAFGYELLRKHFSDVDAHRAFCFCLHPIGPKLNLESPVTVQPGTAVCYQEDGAESDSWVVIEDLPNPDPSRNELSPTNHIARQLIGRKVGKTVVLVEGSITTRTAVIKEITSKYVYRYLDCMGQWQLRFPDAPEIELVRVKPDPCSEALDVSTILASVDRRAERVERVKEIYRSIPVTIHMFGELIGKSAFDATEALATSPDMKVNCCLGNDEEQSLALEALKSANTVIVDLTALATLAMLDDLRLLAVWPKDLAISQATLGELHERLRHEKHQAGEGAGVLSKVDGKYSIFRDTTEGQAARVEKLEKFIGAIEQRFKVLGCLGLASLDSEKRSKLVKGCGQHGAESLVLASAPGAVLWTDDHTLARLGKGEFGVRRVWTQAVLQNLTLNGHVDARDFYEASAKLLGWSYAFTSPSAPALEQAGVLARWNPGEWPLKQACEIFADESLSLLDSLRLAAAFLVIVYSGKHLPETEKTVVAAFLERLAKRQGGISGVRAMLEVIPRVFGINVIGCQRAVADLRAWVKHALAEHPEIV